MSVYVLKISRIYKLLPGVSSLKTGIGEGGEEKGQTKAFFLNSVLQYFFPSNSEHRLAKL